MRSPRGVPARRGVAGRPLPRVVMYDAGEFDWPAGALRPRYEKALTPSKAEGALTFSAGFWKGIGDGEHPSASTKAARRAQVPALTPSRSGPPRRGRVVAVVGAAHGASLPPKAADGPRRRPPATLVSAPATRSHAGERRGERRGGGEREEEEEPRRMFGALLELDEDVKEESADVPSVRDGRPSLIPRPGAQHARRGVGKREARLGGGGRAGARCTRASWGGASGSRKNSARRRTRAAPLRVRRGDVRDGGAADPRPLQPDAYIPSMSG